MDNNYGVYDSSTVLKAGPTPTPHHSPYIIDTVLIKPTTSANMHLSHAGLYDRIKCEDMASDISGMLSRAAAAQLYEKTQIADTLRYSAYAGVDFRGLRSAPMSSCVPSYDVMDFIASSNSFNFLTSTNAEQLGPCTMDATSISTSMNGMGMHVHEHTEHERKPLETMRTTSSLSKFVVQEVRDGHQSQISKFRGTSASKADLPIEFTSKSLQPHDHIITPSDHFSSDILTTPSDSSNSPNSPSKQDSVLSAEDLDADWSKNQSPSSKRRKTQQKRVVCVPVGDAKQLKGETPPPDLWAWRKYGQKPIKGSPYPRGYYRCSSSKGCSARKQVERSCADPTMLLVTYTSDHNHTWPISKTSTVNPQITPKQLADSKEKCEDQSEEAATSSSCEVVNENLFSSIINSVSTAGEQVVSSLESLQEEESFSLKRDVDLCFLSRITTTEEDGVFDDLGELPEMSSIFSKGYLEDLKHKDDGCYFV